jgi:hypothetical protein
MIDEAAQHALAKSTLQRALLRAGLPFGPSFFSTREANEAVEAIEWMIDTRMALREREILNALRRTIEEQDESARSVVASLGHGSGATGGLP